jgi:hypothetical protein
MTTSVLALVPTTYYRNSDVKVRSPRVMIQNPDRNIPGQENAQLKIVFERVATKNDALLGVTEKQVTSCEMPYEPNPAKEAYNGATTFTLPDGIISGVTSLTYDQYYAITALLFDHCSKLQDNTDTLRESFQAARAAQGITSPIV